MAEGNQRALRITKTRRVVVATRACRGLHSRRGEVRITGPCWGAEALHALSRLGLHLLLGLGRGVVMMDVVVVNVLRGLSAGHQNFGGHRIRTHGGSMAGRPSGTRPIRRAGARRVAGHARRLAARSLQDTGQVLIQDGLRVFLALVGGGQQGVLERGAAK